jgi:hypothetical protein
LRGSATSAADQNFLDEDLEVSCVLIAKYCSKLYQLQVCTGDPDNCDDDDYKTSIIWKNVNDTETVSCQTLPVMARMNGMMIPKILRCCHLSHARPFGARRLMVTEIFLIAQSHSIAKNFFLRNSGTLKLRALSKTRRKISAVSVVLMKVPI